MNGGLEIVYELRRKTVLEKGIHISTALIITMI